VAVTESEAVRAARAEVERSRARLVATGHELQQRLAPRTIARDAWQGAKEKGAGLAGQAVGAVRQRPIAAGAVATAVALFAARGPLLEAAGRLFNDDHSKDGEKTHGKRSRRSAES
jgi:hypothetical protein